MNGPPAFLFAATQVRLRRFTYILSGGGGGRAEAEKRVGRHSSTVPVADLSSPPRGSWSPKCQAQVGVLICSPLSWLSAHSHCFEGISGKPAPESTTGSHWGWKTHAAGAPKWRSQELSACLPPALSCSGCSPIHSVVPHDAKSGQRAYLRQINQQSQVVSRLETICLGSVLSTVSRQKPRQIWMSWTEPKEPGELSRSTPSRKICV